MKQTTINKKWPLVILLIIVVILVIAGIKYFSKVDKEYSDITKYTDYRASTEIGDNFSQEGMLDIWPEEISGDMDVQDFILVYEKAWDDNYLGFLKVEYTEDAYESEVKRLGTYQSASYEGRYGVTGFFEYNLLAIYASDDGFVYALTDDANTIVYVELVFPGGQMDIDYSEYIDKEYLPDGLKI